MNRRFGRRCMRDGLKKPGGVTNPILTTSGLQFYVDRLVASPTLSGSDVTAWNDLSAGAKHLNSTSATKPQWSAGNGVVFTKTNSTRLFRANANIIGSGAYTLFLVMRFDATSATDQGFFGNTDNAVGGANIAYSDGGVCWQYQYPQVALQQDNSAGAGPAGKSPPVGSFVVATARRPAASNVDWRINDGAHTFSSNSATFTDPGASAQITMGGRGTTADQFANVTVAAAGIYNVDIGAAAVTTIVSYLRTAYGI